MSENPALERGSVRSCTGRNLKRMEVEAITVHSSRKNLLPFNTMDISELLARFNADRPLVINRAGSATVARLACAAVSSGRRVAVVVRSREELASMRGLVSLFTPELSVGRPDSPAQGSPQAAEAPLWKNPGRFFLLSIRVRCPARAGRGVWRFCMRCQGERAEA